MTELRIYHNPRCSKSRQTLALIEAEGVSPEIVLYLDTPPDRATLRQLLKKLGMSTREVLRRSEAEYKDLGLSDSSLSEEALLDALCEHPRLLERPIVVSGDRAIIGRPPENVLELLR